MYNIGQWHRRAVQRTLISWILPVLATCRQQAPYYSSEVPITFLLHDVNPAASLSDKLGLSRLSDCTEADWVIEPLYLSSVPDQEKPAKLLRGLQKVSTCSVTRPLVHCFVSAHCKSAVA